MDLRKLSDEELAKRLTALVAKERSLLCVIIMHVMEISRRGSFLKTHANVFSYLTELLKYSHGSAQRRRDAAILALEVPELLNDVNSGALNLSQITSAQAGFRLAEKTFKAKVAKELKQEVLLSIRDKSVAESEVIIYSLLGIKPKTKSKIKRQADGSVRIEMTLSKSQWAKLEHAKELVSHSVPNGHLDEFIEYLCERVIAYKDKTKPRPERAKQKYDASSRKEHDVKIPAGTETPAIATTSARAAIKISVQRKIFARDRCCQYKNSATGEICSSRWQLQLDHIQPVWAGGSDAEENLRLLCGAHNRKLYRDQSGVHGACESKSH